MLDALKSKLASEPGMTQRELAVFLRKEFNVIVSRATIGRVINRVNLTRKISRNIAKERDPDLRDEYIYNRSGYHPEHLVIIDESGCDLGIGNRKHGYAPKGVTPEQVKQFHRGNRVQILPAYTLDGVLYSEVYEGSTTTEVFDGFIERLLPDCGKFQIDEHSSEFYGWHARCTRLSWLSYVLIFRW